MSTSKRSVTRLTDYNEECIEMRQWRQKRLLIAKQARQELEMYRFVRKLRAESPYLQEGEVREIA